MSDRDALRDAIATALKRLPYADVIVPDDAWAGDYADAAIAAIEAADVRLVPILPTEHMEREMVTVRSIQDNQGWKDTVDIYRTGVAASPYAPGETGGE